MPRREKTGEKEKRRQKNVADGARKEKAHTFRGRREEKGRRAEGKWESEGWGILLRERKFYLVLSIKAFA